MNLRGHKLTWEPPRVRRNFLTGKNNNPTGELAGQYASAYSGLLKGGGADPFSQLFQTSLGPTLAAAKESAGNLTGTGLGNTLGTAAGRSLSQFLLSILGQGASFAGPGAQQTHTPGFLDYLFSAAGKAAPFLTGIQSPGGGGGGGAGPSMVGADAAVPFLFA